ncbi:MAG TPA: hypothetical protein VJ850_07050 [Candidatus Limnocylindrales bacterium]|nr:hypothetical protein [Candidatus Limnocylindrales bacterium]
MSAIAFPRARSRPADAPRIAIPLPRISLLTASSFVLYIALGSYLALVLHAFHGDAYSRVANAYYVLFSRDPHLAAIGFVWMPLPSLFELVLVPLKVLFPAMTQAGFAAVVMSATFMALAVSALNGTLADLGVHRGLRLVLVLAFALNPMIVYYGAIGTSEGPTLFFAILTCRYLLRYAATASTGSLVGAGLGIAGGYLTRYEAAASAVGVALFIVLLSLARLDGSRRSRLAHAAGDIAVALTPFVMVFVAWAVASWLIVGSPFTQFTSDYGNSNQMRVWAEQGANEIGLPLLPSLELTVLRLAALSAAAPLALLLGLGRIAIRRDFRVLAVGAVLTPMLGFMVLAYVVHVLAPWLRYFILVIPLALLVLGIAVAPSGTKPAMADPAVRPRLRRSAAFRAAMAGVIALAAIISVPVTGAGMLTPAVAVEESRDVGALLGPKAGQPDRPGAAVRTFASEASIAAYLDSLRLPSGSVLVDVFSAFPIVVFSDNPDQFVATTDRDFKQVLADPGTFGVRYLLVPSIEGHGQIDAINHAYPHLDVEADFVTVERQFPALGTSSSWTLYRLVSTEAQ